MGFGDDECENYDDLDSAIQEDSDPYLNDWEPDDDLYSLGEPFADGKRYERTGHRVGDTGFRSRSRLRKALVCFATAALVLFSAVGALRITWDRKSGWAGPAIGQTGQKGEINGTQGVQPSVNNDFYYIHSQLSGEDQDLYDEICAMVAAHEAQTELRCSDPDKPLDIYLCVIEDHPEFFWAKSSATGSWYMKNGEVYFTLMPKYSLSLTECRQRQKKLDTITADLRAEFGSGTEYDKVKGVYEYIIEHARYEIGSMDQSLCPVLLEGHGVCSSYAKSTQYLLQQLGIQALYVRGQARGGSHAWNVVRIDGDYYQLDTTWGDPITEDGKQIITYDCFCVTSREIGVDHIPDPDVYCPDCTAVDANYFRQEGRYFTSVDSERIEQLFAHDTALRQPIRLRASGRVQYEVLMQWLLEEEHIFGILSGLTTTGFARDQYRYSTNEMLYILEIRLNYT